ncbi:uncharacterized protein LOC108108542 [Drosophila eugracilis]|uniref:uncharacterized protein LOC108108542 n=1 Tax=Drosophila eugracilis TaxID=29029 RepID=UPI0007E69F16|nr:uncharacterized protein LOC108108542 [Drosophila eugracilis]
MIIIIKIVIPLEFTERLFEGLSHDHQLHLALSNPVYAHVFANYCKQKYTTLDLDKFEHEAQYLSHIIPICGSSVEEITGDSCRYSNLELIQQHCTNVKSITLAVGNLSHYTFVQNMKSITTLNLFLHYDDPAIYDVLQELPLLTALLLTPFSETYIDKILRLVDLEMLCLGYGKKECPLNIIQICNTFKKLSFLVIQTGEITGGTLIQTHSYSTLRMVSLSADKVAHLPSFPKAIFLSIGGDSFRAKYDWNSWIMKHANTVLALEIGTTKNAIVAIESCKALRALKVLIWSAEASEGYLSSLLEVARRKGCSLELVVNCLLGYLTVSKVLKDTPNTDFAWVTMTC